jgi:hypothetical protein
MKLRDGKSTPEFVEKMLSVFGNNPHGDPNYRLIWSERKMIYFAGEIAPEYLYLDPCWLFEMWLPAIKAAGPESNWNSTMEFLNGEYPRSGIHFYVKHYPSDWEPSEENIRLLAHGIEMSKHLPYEQRVQALRENLAAKERASVLKVAGEIEELFDSAAQGRIQQPVSGKKNNFRTPEDFERDQERIGRVSHKEYAKLPKAGGKLIR